VEPKSPHQIKPSSRVLIVAGEASGDQHAARLVEEVHRKAPDVRFAGIGGPRMRAAGVDIVVDSRVMAVVGLFEVLAHFPTIYGALRLMRRKLREERPDLLILVDYPDFNLRLAKTARALGIKVLYYISPQVWAWRQKRVHKIGRLVDMMAVVFPFEVPFYEKANVPVRFVGHPLAEEVDSSLSVREARVQLGLETERPVIGLFPGSRRSEISRLLPVLVEAAQRLGPRDPKPQFVLPRASTLTEADLLPHIERSGLDIRLVADRFYDVVRACDVIMSASGTATLEIALMGVPLVVIYKVAPLSYRIMSALIKVDHIALCNIVAGKAVAPELLQEDASAERIAEEVGTLLDDPSRRAVMQKELSGVRERLGGGGGSINIAKLTLEMLGLV
jgi:lipid-A-disaccharide synthase